MLIVLYTVIGMSDGLAAESHLKFAETLSPHKHRVSVLKSICIKG